jgi:cobalt-zinc-cadmium resistance protein CzcA
VLERVLRFSVHHRILVVMLTLAAAALGVVAAQQLPIDAVPDITTNQVVVNTVMPSMSPVEVEKQVTTPIEMTLAGIPGMQLTRSHSWNGFSQVTAEFANDVDPYFARQQVSERLAEARDQLPPGAEPKLGGMTTGLGDVYMYVVEYEHPAGKGAKATDGEPGWQSDGSYLTPERQRLATDLERQTYLRTVQDWIIRPQVKGVKDVADVDEQGGYVKQYEVQPDPMKLVAYGLSFRDVTEALRRNNSDLGAGYVEHKGEAFVVRTTGRLENAGQIGSVVLAQHNGTPVYVRDVATVGAGKEVRSGAATADGSEVVLGVAQMLVGANSRTVAAAVHERVGQIKLPPDVRTRAVLNRTTLVESTIRTVFKNLAEGAILVVVVLFLLLGNVRAALITALAIPLSMLLTASGMVQGRISGNLMSLGAIDFGLIVDGAVIIVENCLRLLAERQRQLGRPLTKPERLEVVIEASTQVRGATAFGEAIIIVVYLPILALVGVAGKMYRPMALTVIVALAAAFVLSLTFVPAMVALFMGGRVRERENRPVQWARRAYGAMLGPALRRRWSVVFGAAAAFLLSLLLLTRLGSDFVPRLDEGDVLVIANRMPSTSLTESVRSQVAIERAIKRLPEIQAVASKIGTGDAASDPIPMSGADTFIALKPADQWPDPHKPKAKLLEEIEEAIAPIPGNTYEFLQPIEDRFNELISGVRLDVAAKVTGEDFDQTLPAANQVYAILRKMNARDLAEPKGLEGLPLLRIDVDRAAAARYGLNVEDVQEVVGTAIGGREAGVVFEGERRFDIVVRLPEELRQNLGMLADLPVPLPRSEPDAGRSAVVFPSIESATGVRAGAGFVPLSSVAHVEMSEGPSEIVHEDGKRNVLVTCNLPRGRDTASFVAEAQRRVNEQVVPRLPAGNAVVWGGQYQTIVETWRRLGLAIPLAFVLILTLLYTTFHSFKHALIVFSGVPLALTGGIVALWLRGIHLSISAGVGFIALSGVAVLNGLVMVTFINQLRREGKVLNDAIVGGSLTRLRPVLMTALVASLGFVPMAVATGPGAEVQKPLATVVIGGIISSTLLTLFVLPALYRLCHRDSAQPQ